jgi:excisionase family DNA binding protein
MKKKRGSVLPVDAPVLATVDETANLLRVSRRQVFNWISDGTLDSIKVGSIRRVKMASVRRFAGG